MRAIWFRWFIRQFERFIDGDLSFNACASSLEVVGGGLSAAEGAGKEQSLVDWLDLIGAQDNAAENRYNTNNPVLAQPIY